MTRNMAKQIGDNLIELAELLSDDVCEVTADEILENIESRSICEEDAGEIKRYLSA